MHLDKKLVEQLLIQESQGQLPMLGSKAKYATDSSSKLKQHKGKSGVPFVHAFDIQKMGVAATNRQM